MLGLFRHKDEEAGRCLNPSAPGPGKQVRCAKAGPQVKPHAELPPKQRGWIIGRIGAKRKGLSDRGGCPFPPLDCTPANRASQLKQPAR